MKNSLYILLIIVFQSLISCENSSKPVERNKVNKNQNLDIKYAKGFNVADYKSIRLIDICDPLNESNLTYHYALVKKGIKNVDIPKDYIVIETPIKSAICMTNLQLSSFIKLNAINRVVGVTSSRFLFNEQIKAQLKEGKTNKIGIEGEFDKEMVIAINPDIILVSPFKRGGYESLKNLDIPLVTFLGYKENSPLGQAEWIKFIGLLLGEEEAANSIFLEIENKYNTLKQLVKSVDKKPVVLSGEMHSGNWYAVGGNSYLAQLFNDSGAKYFMKDNNESGGFYVDFETVYSQGAEVEYWRMVNNYDGAFSYEALKNIDSRYEDFRAFKDKKIIYCNLRQKPFYENTPLEPEVVLADLIKIFHPSLLPNHTPVYYELLK